MSVSAIFGSRLVVVLPQTCSFPTSSYGGCAPVKATPRPRVGARGGGLVIESSSRPQKKATAHHRKSRPKKTQPWDIKRGPTVYPPLPELPPEWTLVTDIEEVAAAAASVVAVEAVVSSSSSA